MPHAIEDEIVTAFDEDDLIRQAISRSFVEQEETQFDQAGKADDAVDYEDFDMSDEELPQEEEATNGGLDDEHEDRALNDILNPSNSLPGLPTQQPTNGIHTSKRSSGDLFGDSDEVNDLFGEQVSSPEEDRRPKSSAPLQQRPSGLALPSKSGLALPSFASARRTPTAPLKRSFSSSPPVYTNQNYDALSPPSTTDEDEDIDPQAALQRRLLSDAKRKLNGEDVDSGPVETDMSLFSRLYPDYEEAQAPNFIGLFPPHSVSYKGKVPLKLPKVLQPTKLSLDLLQDQERGFKSSITTNKAGQESTFNNSIMHLRPSVAAVEDSDMDSDLSTFDEGERTGGMTMQDLAIICQDWDAASDSISVVNGNADIDEPMVEGDVHERDCNIEDRGRPWKRRKVDSLHSGVTFEPQEFHISFEEPERAVARLAKSVTLDLNDTRLLIDEHAPQPKRKLRRLPGDKRDAALSRDIAKRYNISNDHAYDLLKENHQNKVRSTIGGLALEHSNPATKLQYPFYRVGLDNKAKRAFHRPYLELKNQPGREYRFQKPRHIKRKSVKGRDAKEVFAKAEDLSLGDNASLLLLEYSEEAPMMMSNFGMGNRLINYYRKKAPDDPERPKRDVGESQVLLQQDKSPFSNFGLVEGGETVPTIQNGLYRAPVFSHKAKTTDLVIGISSTWENGDRLFLRNAENLHVVGQQFPLLEVPGQHSRKVTDAAKKRLRALSYRIYAKSLDRKDKVLDNATLMPHLPGHDMPQTRSKMREFMKYEKVAKGGDGSSGVWVPQPGQPVPDAETLRGWIRPEDVCLLDSMQVGVQHLADLGLTESKDAEDDKELDEGSNIEQQLAPWRATKNFLNACQGKAMLKLHGDGDPTSRGEGFSFVKTSMKGGFQAQGESAQDKMNAKKRKETGGHSYNVAEQQKSYDDSIKRIWSAQKHSLASAEAFSDDDMDDDQYNETDYGSGRGITPRSSFSTPAAFTNRNEEDSMSQFSGQSAGRGDKVLTIRRSGGSDINGNPLPDVTEVITDSRVIKEYRAQTAQKKWGSKSMNEFVPTGDAEHDEFAKQQILKELTRIQRNADRRIAREKLRAKNAVGSHSTAASPDPSDADAPASATNFASENATQKGKGRSKDGTARKCANCGQVGHIKTNRKSVSTSTYTCSNCTKQSSDNIAGIRNSGSRRRKPGNADQHAGLGDAKSDRAAFASDSYSAFVL